VRGATRVCRLIPGLIALACAWLMLAPGARAATAPALTFADADGIHVVSAQQLDPRQYDVTVLSGALGQPVHVRILVPSDYGATSTRYPVLYLFHGTFGGAADWVNYGAAEQTTAGLPLIVVMPDCGLRYGDGGGWFTNWVDQTTAYDPAECRAAYSLEFHIPVHLDDYELGTHSWAYWTRDVQQYVPQMMAMFAHPPAPPSTISYESIDQSWSQWGWSVALDRPAAQQVTR